MREICIDLDPETVEELATEGAVAGFEDPAEYVRWLVANRDGIDETPERDHLLEAYRERFVELKREASRSATEETEDGQEPDSAPQPAPETDPQVETADPSSETPSPASLEPEAVPVATAEGPSVTAGPDNEPRVANTDGGRPIVAASVEGAIETPTPQSTPSPATPAEEEPAVEEETADHTQSTLEETKSSFGSVNLTPERVTRIEGDPVSADADVLGSVETDRVDELSRRAVAQTRKQLNRDVETGLEYDSSTALFEDIPLGEDVADLETLEVPARTPAEERTRREVAGRAIAMLRDEERARKSDFVDALYEEYPAGYDSADSWWRCVKAALEQVDVIEGGRVWQFSG